MTDYLKILEIIKKKLIKSKEIVKFNFFSHLQFLSNPLILLRYLINLIDKIVYIKSAIFVIS